jgi:hypothetical protein
LHTNHFMERRGTLGSPYVCLMFLYLIHDAPRIG